MPVSKLFIIVVFIIPLNIDFIYKIDFMERMIFIIFNKVIGFYKITNKV